MIHLYLLLTCWVWTEHCLSRYLQCYSAGKYFDNRESTGTPRGNRNSDEEERKILQIRLSRQSSDVMGKISLSL